MMMTPEEQANFLDKLAADYRRQEGMALSKNKEAKRDMAEACEQGANALRIWTAAKAEPEPV